MLRNFLCFFSFILLFSLFSKTNVSAKEYCHIHVNGELQETIELPFYFFTLTLQTEVVNSWPKITYTTSYETINSATTCESIKGTVYQNRTGFSGHARTYGYAKDTYDDLSEQERYSKTIKFSIADSKIRGYSKIIDEEPPTISGYKEYYTSNVDSPITLALILRNISAYDNRDGNITSNINIEFNEYDDNKNKLGTYPIIISVEDSAGNKTSITFYIEIVDKTKPTLTGPQLNTSFLSNPINIEEIKNKITVEDNIDKNLSSQIYICEDNYSMNKSKIGLYDVYFCVYDSSSNPSDPFKVTVQVKDDIPPIIEGLDYYDSFLSNPITVEQIMYSLAASDNHEDISENIFITNDYYTTYKNTLGEKNIIFQVMDSSDNISTPFKVTINLIDDIKPQIFGLNTYNSNLSSPLSLTHLKQQLTVLDNFDGNISTNLEIIEDTYTPNINKIGTYNISFQAKDYSNNISEIFKINITNIDDVAPTIIGPNTLKYSIDNKPHLSNILTEFNTIDNVDSNLELTIETDTYSESITTGTYYLTLSCIDSSNNKSPSFTTKIEILDILLNLNELTLSLPTSKKFTIEEINKIINLNEKYVIVQDTYSPNYSTQGTYTIEYTLTDYTKLILTINTYTIKESEETKISSTTQKKETFLNKIISFFSKIYNYIKQFLKKLFLYIFI